jgi:hypothetical protein
MAKKDATYITQKYQQRVAGAAGDYQAGVQNPSRPWAQATQAGAARWRQGLTEAFQANKFEKGVAKAGDAKWQQNAANKGAQRYAGAAQEAAAGYGQVAARIVSAGEAARSRVAGMPNATQEQRLNRALEAMRTISNAWKS